MTLGRRALIALFVRTKARYIAARCGVSLSAVYNWRAGIRRPNQRAKRALTVNYGIPCCAWAKRASSTRFREC